MVKEPVVDGKELLALRIKLGRGKKITQREFAEMIEIPVDVLKSYESNRRALKVSKFHEIKEKLGYYRSSQESLSVMIDYLRITFKNVTDLDYFCKIYLYCPLSEFVSGDTKLMTYTNLWRRGDIWIFDYADKSKTGNYQITLQLSGKGCRQFELVLAREGLTWGEALQKMFLERKDMKVTRLDVALDELYRGAGQEEEQFDLLSLIDGVRKRSVLTQRVKKWNYIGGGALGEEEGEGSDGLSLYFGSRQSSTYFNFYEKRFELAKKEGMTVEQSLATFGIWNRFEIRFNQTAAQKWVEEFVTGVPLEELSKGVVNGVLDVYEGVDEKGFYVPDRKWQQLFGGVDPVKLTTKPEPYSIERTIKWLIHQVSNSLRLVEEVDGMLDTDYLGIVLKSGELTDNMDKILKNLSPDDVNFLRNELSAVG